MYAKGKADGDTTHNFRIGFRNCDWSDSESLYACIFYVSIDGTEVLTSTYATPKRMVESMRSLMNSQGYGNAYKEWVK